MAYFEDNNNSETATRSGLLRNSRVVDFERDSKLASALANLKTQLSKRSVFVLPSSPLFDAERLGWNRAVIKRCATRQAFEENLTQIVRRPALIIKVAGVSDIVAAIKWAQSLDVVLAVRR